jgi:hypothetical protein
MIIEQKIVVEIAANVPRRQHIREEVERGAATRSQPSWRQQGVLDCNCARHFLTMRAPLNDLLRQAAKRMREVDKLRQWCIELVEQAQVEVVMAERLQRIGVKSDRLIERLKSAPNLHQHRGKKSRVLAAELLQVAALDAQYA